MNNTIPSESDIKPINIDVALHMSKNNTPIKFQIRELIEEFERIFSMKYSNNLDEIDSDNEIILNHASKINQFIQANKNIAATGTLTEEQDAKLYGQNISNQLEVFFKQRESEKTVNITNIEPEIKSWRAIMNVKIGKIMDKKIDD
jgi:hypothetical protein